MPSFGKLDDGGFSSASSTDKTSVSSATPASNGTVSAGHMRMWIDSGSTTVRMVIYADSAGAPAALLAQSDALSLTNTAEAQVDFVFTGVNRIAVVSTATYWIGATWQDPGAASVNISRDITGARAETGAFIPNPFGAVTSLSGPVDAFIDFGAVSTRVPRLVSQYNSYH